MLSCCPAVHLYRREGLLAPEKSGQQDFSATLHVSGSLVLQELDDIIGWQWLPTMIFGGGATRLHLMRPAVCSIKWSYHGLLPFWALS